MKIQSLAQIWLFIKLWISIKMMYKMKNVFVLLLTLSLIYSCKEEKKASPSSVKGLKEQKIKLEISKDSITNLILVIDEKLSKLDTLKRIQEVSILKLQTNKFEHFISLQGNTITDENVIVHPKSSGTVTAVFVKEGQYVSKGATLLKIDDIIMQNSINEVKNQLVLANTTFERQQRLWNQKIGSEMQFLQAKNNKESLENKIKTLQSQLNNYRVKAPFSGVVDELIVHVGDMASPQAPALRIVNLNKIYVQSEVSENYLKSIKKGAKVKVYFNSLDQEFESRITQVGNYISPDNRTFKIKIPIKNRKGLIKPNLLADIKVQDYNTNKAIVIPSNLVQIDENGKKYVFTVIEKNNITIVVKKLVEIGKSFDNKTEIKSGIQIEDVLINEGSRSVSFEQEVIVVE